MSRRGRPKKEKKGKAINIYTKDVAIWEEYKSYARSLGSKPSRLLEQFMLKEIYHFRIMKEMLKEKNNGDEKKDGN